MQQVILTPEAAEDAGWHANAERQVTHLDNLCIFHATAAKLLAVGA